MRFLLLVCLSTAVAAADPTHELDDHAISTLAGCWQTHGETWTFRKTRAHGLEIIRELGNATYAARARLPRDVMFDPKTGDFGFGAAGRIHAALYVFRIGKTDLQAWPYWKPDQSHSYVWSGNTISIVRCGTH